MVDFSALIREEAQTTSNNRNEWSGEIGGTEVTIYAKPLCPADFDYVGKRGYRDFAVSPSMGGMVELIARKAETESGTKCFKPNSDVAVMKRWGNEKIGSIFAALFGDDLEPETEEQYEARVGN
jgi:hypothetical protein